jgi:transcriptional regulator with XRE-family HTH domain
MMWQSIVTSFKLPIPKLTASDPTPAERPTAEAQPPVAIVDLVEELEPVAAVGALLRRTREEKNYTIEEISANTRIPVRTLLALESGQTSALPETIYIRGLVKRYGDFLGIDGNSLAEEIREKSSSIVLVQQEATLLQKSTALIEKSIPEFEFNIRPIHLYIGYVALIVGTITALTAVIDRSVAPVGNTPTPPSIAPSRLVPVLGTEPQSINSPDSTDGRIAIGITVRSNTWAKVSVDGQVKFEGNLQEGAKLKWTARQRIEIQASDGGALLISQNNSQPQQLGKPGRKEQVIYSGS